VLVMESVLGTKGLVASARERVDHFKILVALGAFLEIYFLRFFNSQLFINQDVTAE